MAENEFKMKDNRDKLPVSSEQQQLTATISVDAATSDSGNDAAADVHFFEGVEKLLEIWFEPSKNADMRKVPR